MKDIRVWPRTLICTYTRTKQSWRPLGSEEQSDGCFQTESISTGTYFPQPTIVAGVISPGQRVWGRRGLSPAAVAHSLRGGEGASLELGMDPGCWGGGGGGHTVRNKELSRGKKKQNERQLGAERRTRLWGAWPSGCGGWVLSSEQWESLDFLKLGSTVMIQVFEGKTKVVFRVVWKKKVMGSCTGSKKCEMKQQWLGLVYAFICCRFPWLPVWPLPASTDTLSEHPSPIRQAPGLILMLHMSGTPACCPGSPSVLQCTNSGCGQGMLSFKHKMPAIYLSSHKFHLSFSFAFFPSLLCLCCRSLKLQTVRSRTTFQN